MSFISDDENYTVPAKCSSLRVKGYAMLKGRPCKIAAMSTSAPGKHGKAKVHLVGFDLFTGKRIEDLSPSTHNIQVPKVAKKEYQILFVSACGGFMTLLDESNSEMRSNFCLPEGELGESIAEQMMNRDEDDSSDVMCTILSACGEEAVVAVRSQHHQA